MPGLDWGHIASSLHHLLSLGAHPKTQSSGHNTPFQTCLCRHMAFALLLLHLADADLFSMDLQEQTVSAFSLQFNLPGLPYNSCTLG